MGIPKKAAHMKVIIKSSKKLPAFCSPYFTIVSLLFPTAPLSFLKSSQSFEFTEFINLFRQFLLKCFSPAVHVCNDYGHRQCKTGNLSGMIFNKTFDKFHCFPSSFLMDKVYHKFLVIICKWYK